MPASELDNPIHTALNSLHAAFARTAGAVCRYPAELAPFLSVPDDGDHHDEALAELVAPGETVYLLGVAPRVGAGWELHAYPALAQMTCDTALGLPDGPAILPLDERHRADVLALTALVYPHYFRPRTMELGRYFGIYVEDRLAAMIGERLGGPGSREMSAICTHPDFLGRGYAQRLTAMLNNDTLARGGLPFLHVSHENTRAEALYQRLGYRLRRDIGFWALRRADNTSG